MTIAERSPSLAVLIDADNASARYAKAIFDEIAKFGEANVRRIYGDFSDPRLKGWREVMQPLAIVPSQQFNYTTGKNAADITLVIEAMDLMHRGHLDGFCLVSSDSDFTRLASRLREEGAVVYGFGKRNTPEAFRNACNRFIYVEKLLSPVVDEPTPKNAETAAKSGPSRKKAPEPGTKKESVPDPKMEPTSKAVPIILKAMVGLEDDEGWAVLGGVGSRIPNIAPDFDPRTYGHSKLSTLVEKSGMFDMKSLGGTGLMIRPRNPKRKAAAK